MTTPVSRSLHNLINRDFGVRTRDAENRGDVSMTTTAAIVLSNDSSRLAAIVVNLGGNDVFVRPNVGPSSTTGIRLAPNGGTMVIDYKEDFHLVGKEWQGVTSSGTSTLYTLEVLIEPGQYE